MSFQAMTWAIEQPLPALPKLVLLMLANRTNHETGICIFKIRVLAAECGMSETACKNAIKHLIEAALLRVEQRFHEGMQLASQYHLCLENVTSDARRETPTGRRETPGVGRQTPTDGRRQTPTNNLYKNINQNKKGGADAPVDNLKAKDLETEGIDPALAADFIQHRKTKGAKLTQRAWAGIKREATKAGWQLSAVLEKIIERNWTGVEADWLQKRGQVSPQTGHAANDDEPWTSAQWIEAQAMELSVPRKPGEDFQWFKCRVAKASGNRKWQDVILADLERTRNQHYAAVYEFFNGAPPMEMTA